MMQTSFRNSKIRLSNIKFQITISLYDIQKKAADVLVILIPLYNHDIIIAMSSNCVTYKQ